VETAETMLLEKKEGKAQSILFANTAFAVTSWQKS
jgi:hypothetical protein